MRYCLLLATSLFLASSCKQYKPRAGAQTGDAQSRDSKPAEAPAAKPDCQALTVLAIKANTRVGWQATKLEGTQESLVVGSNLVSGFVQLKGNDLATASGKFVFDIPSTDSGDPIRDQRIKEYVFGLNRKLGLSFELKSFTGLSLRLPQGAALDLNALGVFQIAGVTADLEIPITLSEKDGAYRLLSRGNFELNIRSLKRQKNAFNLEREITQLLALAPGINMRETVQVIMNMELVDACR